MTTLAEAYSFQSPLAVEEMLDRLNQAGPWTWSLRDSDTYGFYLRCRPDSSSTKLRIVGPPPDYLLAISFDPTDVDNNPVADHTPADELARLILDRILPALDARDVKETQGL